LVAGALVIWCLMSLVTAIKPIYMPEWTRRRELIQSFELAARHPSLCGIGLIDIVWPAIPGSAALPGNTPIYGGRSIDAQHEMASYNVAVSNAIAVLPAQYRRLNCYQGTWENDGRLPRMACVWIRDGGCIPGTAAQPEPNWPPYFTDTHGRPRQDRLQPYLQLRD
jgi:hypothetical protein